MEINLRTAYFEIRKSGITKYSPEFLEYLFRLIFQSSIHGKDFRHLTVKNICASFKNKVQEDFGDKASLILEKWQINCYQDLGEAVFLLAKHGCFSLKPEDTLEEFVNAGQIHLN